MLAPVASDTHAAPDALWRFCSAYVFYLVGLALLIPASAALANGFQLEGLPLAAVHLITLGWLSTSIFAALRVFAGVALGVSLDNRILGNLQWGLWMLGVGAFATGLATGISWLIITGAVGLALGVTGFTVLAIPAYLKAPRGKLTRRYLYVALLSLWAVLVIGFTAGFRRAGIVIFDLGTGYLNAHILMAVFGWAGSTVVGVGSHLVPMFALSGNPNEKPAQWAFPFFALIPLLGIAGAFYPATLFRLGSMPINLLSFGWLAAALGSLLWIVQVAIYAKTRIRRERDAGLEMAAFSTLLLGLSWPLLFVPGVPVAFVGLLIVGWLGIFTLGIFHRTVPFLVWFLRFATKMGRGPMIPVRNLTNARLAAFTAIASGVGVIGWTIALLLHAALAAQICAAILFIGGLSAAFQLRPLTATKSAAPTLPPHLKFAKPSS